MMGKGHGMKKHVVGMIMGLMLALLVSACQPAQTDLPTVAALPTDIPSQTPTPTETLTQTPTATPTITVTPSITPTLTPTDTPTNLPSPTKRPTVTPRPTLTLTPIETDAPDPNTIRILTATAAIVEAPTLATLTPIPAGAQVTARPTSTGTPLVTADVIITEAQFQEQLELALKDNDKIDSVKVDFTPNGIVVTTTARGGAAFTSGTITYTMTMQKNSTFNNYLAMSIGDIVMTGGGDVPEDFFNIAVGDLFQALFDSFGHILDQRLGRPDHDLENLTLTDTTMEVFLYVPR